MNEVNEKMKGRERKEVKRAVKEFAKNLREIHGDKIKKIICSALMREEMLMRRAMLICL